MSLPRDTVTPSTTELAHRRAIARSIGARATTLQPGLSLGSVPNLRVLVGIRPDMTHWGRVGRTKDISRAGSHAGAALGVLPALAAIVAGGRSTDVKSVLRNGAVIDSSRRSHHAYTDAVQAEVAARRTTDHPRRRGRRSFRA
jgi:hypothetical protein